jgi:electron transfer flavoprotein alpha subunit
MILTVLDLEGGTLDVHDRELLGAARILADRHGGAVIALAFDAKRDIDFGEAGADRVIRIDIGGYAPERRATSVMAIVNEFAPKHVLFCEGPTSGGDLGRRVAARLRERPATAIKELGAMQIVRCGGGHRAELSGTAPRILILLPGTAAPVNQRGYEALSIDPPHFETATRLQDRGLLQVDPDTVPLSEALLVCGAGNGVRDWAAFRSLATALGATQGGSRVACDAGNLPRYRQIGASGTTIAARCYLAFGISGAPQHLQGIARCEHVIAVNIDPHAPIVKRADLAIIADAQSVLRAFVHLLESLRHEAQSCGS